ncbi:hypothetical protein SKAU_G00059560 [Synaphobranchus kaupii]|uniref:Uncharacterized protein n=1 Tax=Synaphobranchus kaupii TaxID=118154 RepID=A0A9Q1J9G5_SYNKA|nr:hypothetical protein SKAU_G00059560 [Synaphobranchus kaupii]
MLLNLSIGFLEKEIVKTNIAITASCEIVTVPCPRDVLELELTELKVQKPGRWGSAAERCSGLARRPLLGRAGITPGGSSSPYPAGTASALLQSRQELLAQGRRDRLSAFPC